MHQKYSTKTKTMSLPRPAVTAALIGLSAAVFYLILSTFANAEPPSEEWRTDLDAAITEANEEQQPVLVMFSAAWCPPCQMMKRDVLPQPEVKKSLESWVPVYIDTDKNGALANRYKATSIPTFVVLTSTGEELARFVGGMDAKIFRQRLDSLQENAIELGRVDSELKENTSDPKLLERKADVLADVGLTLIDPSRLEQSLQVYRQVVAADEKAAVKDDVAFLEALLQAMKRELEPAGQKLSAFAEQYPDSPRRPDALFWQAIIIAEQGNKERAGELLKQYVAQNAEGRYAAQAQDYIQSLDRPAGARG